MTPHRAASALRAARAVSAARVARSAWAVLLPVLVAAALAACSTPRHTPGPKPAPSAVAPIDAALQERLLGLDPDHVSDADVREVLAKGPTPRIVLLHGGIYPVHLVMDSFARFLVRMGWPEARLRHPGDGRPSHSPYEPSLQIAGLLAWYYEQEGLMPFMVGHSQGGIQLVKVLYLLAGQTASEIEVWNPLSDSAEARTSIVDPITHASRPVVGLQVPYAAVVGAGGAALLLPNQWDMAGRLQRIPDSVVDFTGFALGVDLIAWNLPGNGASYRPLAHSGPAARVRNVQLPAEYSHVMVAAVAPLARDRAVRDWLNAWHPGSTAPPPASDPPLDNLLFAAEIWFELKKHWVLQAQQAVRQRHRMKDRSAMTIDAQAERR